MPDHDHHTPADNTPTRGSRRRLWFTVAAALTLVALVVAGALLGPGNASTPPRSDIDAVLSIQQPASGGLVSHSCTAVLIEPDRALTAAHCVTPAPKTYKEKVAAHDKDVCGSVDLSDRPADPKPFGWAQTVVRGGTTDYRRGGETSTVAAVHPMPGWDWGEGDDPLQDLAVIELDPPMTITPAKIGAMVPEVGSDLRATGWATRPDRCGGIDPARQQWDVTAVSCHSHAETICVSTGGATGPCEGVSGGPLWATAEDGTTVVVGVYSGSPQEAYCGQTRSLYTRTSAHQKWINDAIGP